MNKKLIFFLLIIILITTSSCEPKKNTENSIEEYVDFYSERTTKNINLTLSDGTTYHAWTIENVSSRFNYPLIISHGRLVYVDFEGLTGILTKDSKKIWEKNIGAHHDLEILDENTLLSFSWKETHSDLLDMNVKDEIITKIDINTGEIIEQFSLLETAQKTIDIEKEIEKVLKYHEGQDRFFSRNGTYNIFHANALHRLRKTYDENIFKKNRVLISIRNINTIALLDLDTQEIVWSWGSDHLDHPHYPTMTEEGNILIYDNGLTRRSYTKILELNPYTKQIVWSYNNQGTEEFHSDVMGSAQKLQNNNLLILNAVNGHIIEINKNGDKLWEKNFTNKIYRYERFTKECIDQVFQGKTLSNRDC